MDPGPIVPRIAHPPAMRAPTVKRIAKSGSGPCTLAPVLHLKYQGDLRFYCGGTENHLAYSNQPRLLGIPLGLGFARHYASFPTGSHRRRDILLDFLWPDD
jgi:hypothetical protein